MNPLTDIIDTLKLQPHPEGGYFRETYRQSEKVSLTDGRNRNLCTGIYFLIPSGVITHWHKVRSDEMWHFYAGAPVLLELGEPESATQTIVLGSDILSGQQPQYTIPANEWQRAQSTGEWSLVGCTVSPGFDFEDFEIIE